MKAIAIAKAVHSPNLGEKYCSASCSGINKGNIFLSLPPTGGGDLEGVKRKTRRYVRVFLNLFYIYRISIIAPGRCW
jgi:hypothetical protein